MALRKKLQIPQRVTALLVYGRPPLVFAGMLAAVAVMWTQSAVLYTLGVGLLFISMSFDLVDGWFAARFRPDSTLAQLADRVMDKVVYSIIFPLIAAGMMWRLYYASPDTSRLELLHAIFVLLLCVSVLIRDNFASFMRGFALRRGQEPEPKEFTRLRTAVAAPVGAMLYAYAFYVPEGPSSWAYEWFSWLGNLPLHVLFLVEIILMIITFGSIAGYSRKYGSLCLDELCFGDESLRRRILSFFPNSLTVMNAMMGALAVLFAVHMRISEAYLMLVGAAVFDRLDGSVARRLGLTEPLPGEEPPKRISVGSILDDISDAISFCIAPALIFYVVLSPSTNAVLQRLPIGIIAIVYGALGIARLIYFTLDRRPVPGFFKGMPTPAAALLVVAPLIMFNGAMEGGTRWEQHWGVFSCGVMLLAAIVMNLYPIRYIHVGRFMEIHPGVGRIAMLIILVCVFTPYFGHISLLALFLYMLSPLVSWRINPDVFASREGEVPSPLEAEPS